jgi:succinate dehydrogenase / fumarate reductase cytochrome b subunit
MIAVTIVGFHLNHAIQSMFQTLGLNNKKYFPAIQKASTILSIVITVALVSIPITVLLGLIGGKL